MNVQLIDYTGAGSGDPLYAARLLAYTKNTRLEQGAGSRALWAKVSDEYIFEQLDYIARTIRSSWEFVDYTFEITGVTRAFTHQFVRTRTGSYAQQSQRSVSITDFTAECPEAIAGDREFAKIWYEAINAIRDGYGTLLEGGVSAQDARGLLPTNVHTNIIAKFNLRTLADLTAKRSNLRAQGEYSRVAGLMAKAVLEVHPWAEAFLHPVRTATPELDAILTEMLGSNSPIDLPKVNAALKELDGLKGVWG